MKPIYEMRVQTAELIFDIGDQFAAMRGGPLARPFPLEPLKLRFFAVFDAGVAVDLDEPLELVTIRNASGFYLYFGTIRLPNGELRQHLLPDGDYVVRIESFLYQEVEVRVSLPTPRDPVVVNLLPGPAYPFPMIAPLRLSFPAEAGCADRALHGRTGTTVLRGTLRAHNGEPIVGASVSTGRPGRMDRPSYITGKSGDWLLVLPADAAGVDWPTGPVTVHVALPALPGGGPVPEFDIADVCVVRGYDTGLLQTAVRGRVVGQDGQPARGIVMTLAGVDINDAELFQVPDPPVTNTNGDWAYYFDPGVPGLNAVNFIVTVRSADGQNRSETVPVMHRATAVVPTIRR